VVISLFRSFSRRKKSKNKLNTEDEHEFPIEIFSKVKDNIENIKQIMDSPSDLVTRVFTIGNSNHSCGIVLIDGLVNKDLLNDKILKNIQLGMSNKNIPVSGTAILVELENQVISATDVKRVNTIDDVMFAILSGDTALFIDGTDQVLIIGSKGWPSRGVEEPVTEAVVRGPRDGFTENLRTNTVHIRRHVRDPNLRFESFKVGRRSKKDVVLTYIDGIAHPDIVEEFRRRLKSIDMDTVLESGYIEQWIEDNFLSPFPQTHHTERPDRVAAAISQGYCAVLLDGTPFVLIAPKTLATALQSPEDYYERWHIGTFVRILRYAAAFVTTFLPAIYIALVSFHPGMIPSKLAFSIASTREGVPFPAVVEAFIMEVTLELLREAGLRLPKPIGQTIGIVGGLVIGEAAVSAGIVSPIMVIVVAITAIASFALPSYSFAISLRIIRFPVMLIASMFGFFGLIIAYIMINIHIAKLKSFGVPYSAPFAPSFYRDWKDAVIRVPILMMSKRPEMTKTQDPSRVDKGGQKE
jgi:spore germination protein